MKFFKKQPKSLVQVSQHEFQGRRVSITEQVTTRAAQHGYLPHENLWRRERPVMKPEPTAGPELSRTLSVSTWLRARSPAPWEVPRHKLPDLLGRRAARPQALLGTSRDRPGGCGSSVRCSSSFVTWSFPPRVCEPSLEVHGLTYKTAELTTQKSRSHPR